MRLARVHAVLAIAVATSPLAPLSSQAARNTTVPVVELEPPIATSNEAFGLILNIRGLPDGKLLVNDARRHQLIMLDAGLRRTMTVLDSIAAAGRVYSKGSNPIIPFSGDSTLFADDGAISFVMIAPDGTLGRTLAPPSPDGWSFITRNPAAIDAHGNLVYQMRVRTPSTATHDSVELLKAFTTPDSILVVRANFATRRVDTIGRIKDMSVQSMAVKIANGHTILTSFIALLPTADDYAVLSDGTVAFVRGHDYHVDVIQPDGRRITGPKLPFDWKRLTDAEKQLLVDSVNTRTQRSNEADAAERAARPLGGGRPKGMASSGGSGGSLTTVADVAFDRSDRIFVGGMLDVGQVPDYYPPIRPGAVKADMQANLWILPNTTAQSINGELIYDVVNNRGELTKRVRIPAGRSIAGFGKNGEIYLMSRAANVWTLERTRLRQ